MVTGSGSGDDDTARAAEAQANAMKARLREDVASWSKARNEETERLTELAHVPAARPRATKAATPARAAAKTEVAKTTPGKPFRMSYDGTSTADYMTYITTRRAK